MAEPSRVDAIRATHEWMLQQRRQQYRPYPVQCLCAVCGTTLEIVRPVAATTHEASCKSQSHPVLLTMLTTFKRSSSRIRLSPSRSSSLSLPLSLWYRYSLCALLTLRIYECLTCVMTVISRSHVRLRCLPLLLLFLLLLCLVLLLLLLLLLVLLLRHCLQRMCGRWLSIYE